MERPLQLVLPAVEARGARCDRGRDGRGARRCRVARVDGLGGDYGAENGGESEQQRDRECMDGLHGTHLLVG